MNIYAVIGEQGVVGIFSTKAKADSVQMVGKRLRVRSFRLDFPFDLIAAGKKPLLVTFSNIKRARANVIQVSLSRSGRDGEITFSGKTRTFSVLLWDKTAAEAETRANVIRLAFITNNNL